MEESQYRGLGCIHPTLSNHHTVLFFKHVVSTRVLRNPAPLSFAAHSCRDVLRIPTQWTTKSLVTLNPGSSASFYEIWRKHNALKALSSSRYLLSRMEVAPRRTEIQPECRSSLDTAVLAGSSQVLPGSFNPDEFIYSASFEPQVHID